MAELIEQKARAFGRTYWMLNSIEMFERLAYFGIRAVVPIYIMQATEPGGLHLTAAHKGWIYAWWAAFQSILPMITGGYADRYGYKKVLSFAISTNILGYLLMAYLKSYYGFFAGILVLATGTAFFKPSLQGSLAQNLSKKNSSMGWGIFYWVVNVGGFLAPFAATLLLGKPHSAEGWRDLFLASAGFTAVNLLLLLTFKDVPSGASKTNSPLQVLWITLRNIAEPRLLSFLLIMSCFWLMMYQLWDLHPNFIEDWVDSADVARFMPLDFLREYGDRGLIRVPQQILLTLNAALIILLVLPISWLVRRMRTLSSMLIGMSMATVGILVAGLTGYGWILLLGIVFFSLGEMLTGPKKNEYLGLIAPPGKKGLYLGYVNIPVGVGVFVGSWLAGQVYGTYGEKATLALRYLESHHELAGRAAQSVDWSDALHKLPELLQIRREEAFALACADMGTDDSTTAARLRLDFRADQGQLTSLALLQLARMPEFQAKIAEAKTAHKDSVKAQHAAAFLAAGDSAQALYVHWLPELLGVSRTQAWEVLRDRWNSGQREQQPLQVAQIEDSLWAEFGSDPGALNNLALEYLAQATNRLPEAVAEMDSLNIKGRIEKRLGIGRTKSFAALSAARGASPEEVEKALAGLAGQSMLADYGIYLYLISKPHHRFLSVARKDWNNDLDLLQQIVGSDSAALHVVNSSLKAGWDYKRLAGKQGIIQAALSAKDWTKAPDQAARLLGLNFFEARVLVAAEIDDAPNTTTRILWDIYSPQYHVWIPFAAIGVLAAIALAIFGQMAKRWADMNA